MKKTALFLAVAMLLTVCPVVPSFALGDDFVDYSSWESVYSGAFESGRKWRLNGNFTDFVIEYEIQMSSIDTGVGAYPGIWYLFRIPESGVKNQTALFTDQDSGYLRGQRTIGDYTSFVTLSADYGRITDTAAAHKMRVSVIGPTCTVEENIQGTWHRLGSFDQSAYNPADGGGSIEIAALGTSAFKLEQINVYQNTFPDYSSWDMTYSEASYSGRNWILEGAYHNFVMEYDISVTSDVPGNFPSIWYNFRLPAGDAVLNQARLYTDVDTGLLCGERTWGNYNFVVFNPVFGKITGTGDQHKMRVYLNGPEYVVQEKVADAWKLVGTFAQSKYNPLDGGGKIQFASGNSTLSLSNIKLYEKAAAFDISSDADGLRMVPLDYRIPIEFGRTVTEEMLADHITVTASGVGVSDYTLLLAGDAKSAWLAFDSLEPASNYTVTISSGLTNDQDVSFSFSTAYPIAKKDMDNSAEHFVFDSPSNWRVEGNQLSSSLDDYTSATLANVHAANFALRYTETKTRDAASYLYLKYGNEGKDWTRLGMSNASIALLHAVNNSVTQYDDDNLREANTYFNANSPNDVFIAVSGDDFYLYARRAFDGTYSLVGKNSRLAGPAGEIMLRTQCPTTFDKMNLYLPSMSAVLVGDKADAAAGSVLVFAFDAEIGDAPAAVTITDGVNDYVCSAAVGGNKKRLSLTLPGDLALSAEYSADFSAVKDIYGTSASQTEFLTKDAPPQYIISEPVYETVGGNKLKTTLNIAKNVESADSSVVMITALYRNENGRITMQDVASTTESSLVYQAAKPVSTTITVPAGGGYFVNTYVWQDVEICNPLNIVNYKSLGN